MSLKDKILNKIADKLKEYRTPEYDKILSLDIKGEVKGVFMTTNCTTIKELKDKSKKGLIDVTEILDEELNIEDKYHYREITFCDKENVVCIYNSKNDSYYEDVHECFESAEERVYIKCASNKGYETFKNYINQSSKYHHLLKCEKEIPRKEAFTKLFIEKEVDIDKTDKKINDKNSYDNYVQITGKVSNIGKEFTKKDGCKARFIEILQEYEYNDRVKYNKITVMLPDELIKKEYKINKDDTISIKGKLNTYNDKDNKLKSVINCSEINILNMSKNQENLER